MQSNKSQFGAQTNKSDSSPMHYKSETQVVLQSIPQSDRQNQDGSQLLKGSKGGSFAVSGSGATYPNDDAVTYGATEI